MKKNFILALAVFCTANTVSAQACITEDFSGDPVGWTLSQGARITDYHNPKSNCSENIGIITPGVGGNNPCNIKTPGYTSAGATAVQMSFDIFVFNANMKCNTWKDFDCETSVDVFYFVGGTKFTGVIDQVLPPNGPSGNTLVNLNVPVGSNLPAGTQYQIQLEFKFKSGTGNCVQQNTKYVIDNFVKCEIGIRNTLVDPTGGTKGSDFTISTNPSNDMHELVITTTAAYDGIQVLDNSGRVVRSYNSDSIIRTVGLEKGTYQVRLTKADAVISVTKNIVVN
ncbi:MAG: T9SS type A sorting domain-containing protein [Ferruginibacter sp.]